MQVTPTLVSSGTRPLSANVNTPIGQIANVINGNVEDDNISASAAINASKLAGGVTGMFGAWKTTWTPTWTNLTVGNGTVVARYQQLGKTVVAIIGITFGSTTSVSGNIEFTLPVTAASWYSGPRIFMGLAYAFDSSVGAANPVGIDNAAGTAKGEFTTWGAGLTFVNNAASASNAPFVWAANDTLFGTFTYEAA